MPLKNKVAAASRHSMATGVLLSVLSASSFPLARSINFPYFL